MIFNLFACKLAESTKMSPTKSLAIQKALENNWHEAIDINLQLLNENPADLDTLNRLAFAYMKAGDFKKSKATYKKVLDQDRSNPIALKNLKKLEMIGENNSVDSIISTPLSSHDLFIEEAGKTKTVELKNLAEKKTLSFFQPGDPVKLHIKRSKIFVNSYNDKFLGMLPDTVGSRLITLMQGGNDYEAFIKSINEKDVVVFIRETKRVARFKNQASFSSLFTGTSESGSR